MYGTKTSTIHVRVRNTENELIRFLARLRIAYLEINEKIGKLCFQKAGFKIISLMLVLQTPAPYNSLKYRNSP